jgi:hypothetical protein
VVTDSRSASSGRPSGRMSTTGNDANTRPSTLSSPHGHRAGAGFTPAQATPVLSSRNAEEGGPRGKHGFPRAGVAGRLNAPRPALVETEFDGAPRTVNRQRVAVVREEWRVVDRWWTDDPVDRRYFEVVLESGQNLCVYRDQEAQSWFTQNA